MWEKKSQKVSNFAKRDYDLQMRGGDTKKEKERRCLPSWGLTKGPTRSGIKTGFLARTQGKKEGVKRKKGLCFQKLL